MTTLPTRIGRYRILDLLGKGAMGTVYRGRDESLERDVAVKVMSLGQADEEARHRFLREGKAAGRLQHPNIVTIYELGEHEGQPFMALELLDGLDLQRAIEAGIRPDPKATLPIVLQLLAGLGHAHEHGIVHRDVKPSNLFLPRGRPAKIMDFGVARLAGGHTATGTVIGTPNYMSPEQARGGALDGRSDLFSAGLILFELVTGEKAYAADTVVAVLFKIVQEGPDFSLIPRGPAWSGLRAVLERSLRKKPEERYADARAMAVDLEQALRDLGGFFDAASGADQALLRGLTPRPAPRPAFLPGPEPDVSPTPPPAASPAPVPAASLPASGSGRNVLWLGGGLLALGVAAVAAVGALLVGGRRTEAPTGDATPSPSPVSAASASPAAEPSPRPPSAAPATPVPGTTPDPAAAAREAPPQAAAVVERAEAAAAPASGEPSLERANDYLESGRYAQALTEAKAVLERDPRSAQAKALVGRSEAAIVIEDCIQKARAALDAGDTETALAEAKRGLAVNPAESRLLDLFREATQ
jgi:serine/threonine-protein kinase